MKLNRATRARDTKGSAAVSAASKTTPNSPAISSLKLRVASSAPIFCAPIRCRSPGKASSTCSTCAIRLNRRMPLAILPESVSSWSNCARTAASICTLASMRVWRCSPKRCPREARKTLDVPRSFCRTCTNSHTPLTRPLVTSSCSSP
ncbi:hypothetical protein SDC9_156569 [bioreactor metagenome]|uniref:Uncharacterized protein n=1 Tax=bioreactor metagenome TaxID=1076179 RepID=A0A645F5X7_9ZZZZ